jgi:chitin disaccharide deacetylase
MIRTMRYLIVNADDFGYSPGVNKGIIEAHVKGIVTSTSVMVDAVAADEAVHLRQFAGLSVGLHFTVLDFNNVQAELDRQIARFIEIVGSQPDHIDTHKLYTSLEGFKDVLPEYAKEHKIPLREYNPAKFIDSFFGMHTDGDVSVS